MADNCKMFSGNLAYLKWVLIFQVEIYEVLTEQVSFFKEKKEGVNQMCEILDEVKRESKLEMLIDLVKDGTIPLDIAAKKSKYVRRRVQKIPLIWT